MAFSDLVNTYKKRLSNDGLSMRDEYINSIKDSFLDSFDSNVSYKEIQYKHNNDLIYTTIPVHFLQFKSITNANEKVSLDDFKRIVFKDTFFIANVGDLVKYNDKDWIVVSTNTIDFIHDCTIQQSNNTLLFYDENSILIDPISIPCIVGNISINTDESTTITTVDNMVPLTLPNTEISRQIKVNDIYKLGLYNYVISSVGNDISIPGLLIFKMKYSEVEQVVPTHSYGIDILNGISASVTQGETLQLNVSVTDNNVEVLSPVITYSSSDELVCIVNSSGLVTAINSEGNCTITATYQGVNDSISISVSTVEFHNYTVNIVPSGILKVGQTITAIAQFMDSGIVTSDIATSWLVLADDAVSSTNLVTITYSGNNCSIKAGTSIGYVRLHVSGVNCSGFVRLKVESLW